MLKQLLILMTLVAFTGTNLMAQETEAAETASASSKKAAVSLGGYVGGVSNYVWRGTRQTNGSVSIQGGLDFGLSAVEGLGFGLWVASIGAGETRNETDYYVSYGGSAGAIDYSVGLTLYSYDFSTFTTVTKSGESVNVAVQKEISLGLSSGDFGFTYYSVIADDSTLGAGDDATASLGLDWISLSYGTALLGMDVSLAYETGSYNQQWVNAGNPLETTAIIAYGLSKSLTDNSSVSFNGIKVMTNSDAGTSLSNEFWMAMDLSF